MSGHMPSWQKGNNVAASIAFAEEHFAGLISLKNLNMASNNLKVVVNADWFPPFRLRNAHFASCQMGPLFPVWLQQQFALIDKIPDWFWRTFSLATNIDISNSNKLSGTLPAHFIDMAFLVLNLSSNQLTGTITQFPTNITVLDFSQTKLVAAFQNLFAH
jgi:hypothetical protein